MFVPRFLLVAYCALLFLSAPAEVMAESSSTYHPAICVGGGPYQLNDIPSVYAQLIPSVRRNLAGLGRMALAASCVPHLTCTAAGKDKTAISLARRTCAVAARAMALGAPSPRRSAVQKAITIKVVQGGSTTGLVLYWMAAGVIDYSSVHPPMPKLPATLAKHK